VFKRKKQFFWDTCLSLSDTCRASIIRVLDTDPKSVKAKMKQIILGHPFEISNTCRTSAIRVTDINTC